MTDYVPTISDLLGRKKPIARSTKPMPHASKKAAAKWAAARKAVLQRDGEVCCECQEWGNDVDHIRKRSTNPEAKYDLANLRVFCRRCHRARHDAEEKLHWSRNG